MRGDVLRVANLARHVAGHQHSRDAAEAIFGNPFARVISGRLKLFRTLPLERADVGVDALRERGDDGLRVRPVCGPLLVPIAAKVDAAREFVAVEHRRPKHLRQVCRTHAPPLIDLEKSIFRGDVALCEKKIVNGGGVNMRYAPAVAQNFDVFLHSRNMQQKNQSEHVFHAKHGSTDYRLYLFSDVEAAGAADGAGVELSDLLSDLPSVVAFGLLRAVFLALASIFLAGRRIGGGLAVRFGIVGYVPTSAFEVKCRGRDETLAQLLRTPREP